MAVLGFLPALLLMAWNLQISAAKGKKAGGEDFFFCHYICFFFCITVLLLQHLNGVDWPENLTNQFLHTVALYIQWQTDLIWGKCMWLAESFWFLPCDWTFQHWALFFLFTCSFFFFCSSYFCLFYSQSSPFMVSPLSLLDDGRTHKKNSVCLNWDYNVYDQRELQCP